MSALNRRAIKRLLGLSETTVGGELNILDGVTATAAEINKLAGVTAGTNTASKALVAGASNQLDVLTVTTLTAPTTNATNIDAGASGAAGSVDVFPTTASKGKLAITCTDQTGNTTVGLVAGAMAQATVLTIPDPGSTTANIITDKGVGGVVSKRVTAQVDNTGVTLANITGLSFTVVPGTYAFRAYLPTTCGGTGGVKLAFNYTTTTLTSLSAMAYAYTASAIATSSTTTTTTQTSIVASNTAFTSVILEGTMVVSTGGTVDLQFAENSANSTSSVLINGNMTFTRIA